MKYEWPKLIAKQPFVVVPFKQGRIVDKGALAVPSILQFTL